MIKTNRCVCLVVSLVLFLQFFFSYKALSAELIPEADAYIYAGSPDSNYGSEQYIKVKFGDTSSKWYKSYLRFNLGADKKKIFAAKLKLFLTDFVNYLDGSHMFTIYGLKDGDEGENWDESTINWNNAPANNTSSGSALQTQRVEFLGYLKHNGEYVAGAASSFSSNSLLSFLQNDSNGKVTLIITSQIYANMMRCYASKENATVSKSFLANTNDIVPEADAYISKLNPDTNFGAEQDLKIQFTLDNCYKTYLRFDIGKGSREFSISKLKLVLTQYANYLDDFHKLSIYGLKDGNAGENWDENSITWNNAPGNDPAAHNSFSAGDVTFLGYLHHKEDYISGAQSSLINSNLSTFINSDTDGKITLIISSQIYRNLLRCYASKENTKEMPSTFSCNNDLVPEADAYIHAGNPDTNYGKDKELKVQCANTADRCYKTYMRFNIGTGPHSLTSVSLKSFLTGFANYLDGTHMLTVYGLKDGDVGENWNEDTITWNNAPGNDTAITGTMLPGRVEFLGYLYHTDDYTQGAVSNFSNSTLLSFLNSDTDGKVTIIVTSEIYWYLHRAFASKENHEYSTPALKLIPQNNIIIATGEVPEKSLLKFNFQISQSDYDLITRDNKQVCLYLDSRIIWGGLGGHATGLNLTINSQKVKGRSLLNKPLEFAMRNGDIATWSSLEGNTYRLFYSADYSDQLMTNQAYPYGLFEADQDPFHFAWDITPLVQIGSNELVIKNSTSLGVKLGLRNVGIKISNPAELINEPVVYPAPTGPLPVFQPRQSQTIPASIQVSNKGDIRFSVANRQFTASSRTSLPNSQWCNEGTASIWNTVSRGNSASVTWAGANYNVTRQVTLHEDHIKVRDTVANTGSSIIGVIFENELGFPTQPQETLLGGRSPQPTFQIHNPMHPSAVAIYNDLVIGMVAEDDIFRMHCNTFKTSNSIVLSDRELGIDSGQSHTLEWSIYMVENGDYWDFVNEIRQNWGCNFTLKGSLTFPGSTSQWWEANLTTSFLQQWLQENPVKRVMTFNATNRNVPYDQATINNPFCYHGTAILDAQLWLNDTRNLVAKMKQADPAVEVFAYVHKNLCTKVGYWNMYRDSVALNDSGTPAESLYTPKPGLFVPTLNNSYGTAMTAVCEYIVDNLDANIYFDEINMRFGLENEWDGCSVKINQGNHSFIGKKNSWLLIQPWLSSVISYLNSKGKTAIANGASATRTMLNWNIQYFFEDGMGPRAVVNGHFGTPLAWGGYLKGQPGYDHAHNNLDYAGIAFTRSGIWNDHFFPITIVELGPGYVIGQERIITNRSGAFGWGDTSHATVYVYNGQGELVVNPDVQEVQDGNNILTEIRMPSDHMAVLVRVP